MHFFFFSVFCIVFNCSWQLIMFDKKQKSCVKRIHLVTDDGLYDRKAFYTVIIVFYSSSMNDGEFMNYKYRIILHELKLDMSEKTASWNLNKKSVSDLPVTEFGFELLKQTVCSCRNKWAIYVKGSFVKIKHNDLRDLTANITAQKKCSFLLRISLVNVNKL